jgi:hypothetical protein
MTGASLSHNTSVDFTCSRCCDKLRAVTAAIGRLARCPACQAVILIPDDEPAVSDGEEVPASDAGAAEGQRADEIRTSPADLLPQPTFSRAFGYVPPAVPCLVDAGDIVGRTWDIYYHRFLRLVFVGWLAMMVCAAAITVGLSLDFLAFWLLLKFTTLEVAILVGFVGLFPAMLPAVWIFVGLFIYLIRLVRGHRARWRDLLRGGPFAVVYLKSALSIGLLTMLGFLLCVVPGLLVMAVFIPALFLIVERDMRPGQAMRTAQRLTRGNLLQLFLVAGVHVGVESLSHLIPCGLGWLLSVPFVTLLWTVTYLRLTGQPTVQYKYHAH